MNVDPEGDFTKQEKRMAGMYPISAAIAYGMANKAKAWTRYFYGNPNAHNDNGDAFRHTYWNALMAKYIGTTKAKIFGDAHETGSRRPIEKKMDLNNNAVGRSIGNRYRWHSDRRIAYIVRSYVKSHKLLRLNKGWTKTIRTN
jgi:hypothetical protein